MNITRRKFLGMLGAATAIGCTTAFAVDTEFRDFDSDAMYFLHDANGQKVLACPLSGSEWSEVLEDCLRTFESWCGELERVFVEQQGKEVSRFISQDGGKDIELTGTWLREFWRRHNRG